MCQCSYVRKTFLLLLLWEKTKSSNDGNLFLLFMKNFQVILVWKKKLLYNRWKICYCALISRSLTNTYFQKEPLKLAPALHFTRSPSSLSLLPYSRAPPMDYYTTHIHIHVTYYKRTLIEARLWKKKLSRKKHTQINKAEAIIILPNEGSGYLHKKLLVFVQVYGNTRKQYS